MSGTHSEAHAKSAVGGRTPEAVAMLLEFCAKYIAHSQHSTVYVGTLHSLLTIYTAKVSPSFLIIRIYALTSRFSLSVVQDEQTLLS